MTYILQAFASILMLAAACLFYWRIIHAEYAWAVISALLFLINIGLFFFQIKIRRQFRL